MLVQTVAGPLAGDRTEIDVDVGEGASLEVIANAATLAFPAASAARIDTRLRVGEGGRLLWRPEPLILAAGCRLESSLLLELAPGAAALTRELVVLGRHGERPGSYHAQLRCELAQRPLLHDAVDIEGGGAVYASPAVLAGARAFGSLALLGVDPSGAPAAGELDLAGPGRVARVLAPDAAALRRQIATAEASLLAALAG